MAVTQYAFAVNADACSGCKTCQVACKDRSNLPAGRPWRRVFEVTAGAWQQKSGVWTPTVVAYHLSVACHHCGNPVCAPVCSTDAIWKRPDGIVLIDESRCTKCYRCSTACPYNAIVFEPGTFVSKCDFCVDLIDSGQPPVCVAACPNRALDYGEYADLRQRYGDTRQVFPLPDPSPADPSLVIRPHRHTAAAQSQSPEVANWEEV